MNVLITGASSGIGQSLAKQYLNQGDTVYACGRDEGKLSALTQYKNCVPLCFDVANKDSVFDQRDKFESLDIIILNAGVCEYIDAPSDHFDSNVFERVHKTNVISVAYCIEAWLPKLKPNGSLVLVSSSAAFLPLPRASAYGSSKAAVSYLAKTLAVELPNHHVCLVSPGFVKTPLTDKNDFPMPFLVDVDKASAMIKKGISKRKSHIQFPFIFMMLMHLFSILPMSVWNKIARRTIKS